MYLKQLVKSGRQYLQDNGYTKSTIYHNYVWHWNTFYKSVGDSTYSYSLMERYVINRFGRNILNSPISEEVLIYCESIEKSILIMGPFWPINLVIVSYVFELYILITEMSLLSEVPTAI